MSDRDRSRRSHRPSPSPSAVSQNNKPKNAAEAQKALLDKLFVDPTKEIVLPKGPQVKTVAPPRDMIPNVQGSSAGAGSGEFHVYKQSRRREYERLKAMETEDAKDKADAAYRAKQEAMKEADDAKTAKNRAKRQKKKDKRSNKGKGKAGTASISNPAGKGGKDGEDEGASSSDDSGSEDGHARQKKRKLANGAPGSVVFRGADEREKDDDQPREEDVKADRIEAALNGNGSSEQAAGIVQHQGIKIVDED